MSAQVNSFSFAKCVEVWDTHNEAVKLVEYMRMVNRFFDVCNSGTDRREWRTCQSKPFGPAGASDLSQPIYTHDDQRLVELTAMAEFMEDWWIDNKARGAAEGLSATKVKATFVTREFYYDFRLCCRSIVEFCHHHLQFCLPGEGIALRWMNQDAVEGLFSLYRAQINPHMGASGLGGIMGSVQIQHADRSATIERKGNVTQEHCELEAMTLAADDMMGRDEAPEPDIAGPCKPAKRSLVSVDRLMTRAKNVRAKNELREVGRTIAGKHWRLPPNVFCPLKKRTGPKKAA
jgi:hypothetical protein